MRLRHGGVIKSRYNLKHGTELPPMQHVQTSHEAMMRKKALFSSGLGDTSSMMATQR